jgi:cell pole-organizing protein PopZ
MSADNDPSMDDILASIRKIISDDEARAQVSGGAAPPPPPAANAPIDLRSVAPRTMGNGSREDVLLLTDLIEEPTLAATQPEPAAPTPIPLQRIDPVSASEMPQPPFEAAPAPRPAPAAAASAPSFEQPLAASSVAGAATSAFDRLNQVVEERKAAPAPAAPAMPGIALGAGDKTIEDLVKEMLRPMLKEWIDRSLPPMVEQLVEREIARLTRR